MAEKSAFTDIHVHCVPANGAISVHGLRRLLLPLFTGQHGPPGPKAARAYMENLADAVRRSCHVRRVVLLALDAPYAPDGKPRLMRSSFSVSNEDAANWCKTAPDIFLFGASVHPFRPDALEALERCAEQGAALVKWLPNSQGIDPADRRLLPFYRKMKDLRLPLLCHTGFEFVLPTIAQKWGEIERLRLALEEGVTVIAAHSGSNGLFYNRPALKHFERLLLEYPNLYADTSGLAAPNRMTALLWWRNHPEFSDRLLFATDFPVPIWPLPWRPFLTAEEYIRFAGPENLFDRMALLLQGLGVAPAPDRFETLLRRAGE